MQTDWIKARQTRYSAYVTVYILVILAVLVLINLLAKDRNRSFDATSNKRYTLSDQTKKIVQGLPSDIRFVYFDRATDFSRGHDLLDRYAALSGKVKVSYVDPDAKPLIARQYGVANYGSLVLEVGTRREQAPGLTEEDVTSALIRATKGSTRTVCATSGGGEPSLDDNASGGFGLAKQLLEKSNYKTQTISLVQKPEIPATCQVVMLGGPRLALTDAAVTGLQNFVQKGGRALLLLTPALKLEREQIYDTPALLKLLSGWGVTVGNDLVLDTSGAGQLFGLNPLSPLVGSYAQHPIVRSMVGVYTAFPIVRSLTSGNGDKVTVEKLFSSGADSYAVTKLDAAGVEINPSKDKRGPFTLALAGTYNTGQPNNNGRFVVVGSSAWAQNSALGLTQLGNRDLFLNMINWLSSDEDLISIRPKDPEDRRITMTRGQLGLVRSVSQFLLPLAIVLVGVSVWWKRR